MPRISFWERSRTYKATNALAEAPFLTLLLPCLSRASLSRREYACSISGSDSKHQAPTAGELERCFFSAVTQAGSCLSRPYQEFPNISFARTQDGPSYRHLQRRWLSSCRGIQNRPERQSAKSVSPPRKSETTSPSTGRRVEHELWHGTDPKGEDAFFKPFYEEVDHRNGSIEQDLTSSKIHIKERKTKLQGQLDELETQGGGSEAERVAYDKLQRVIDSEPSEENFAEVSLEESFDPSAEELVEQIRYLKTVRDLENKLESARHKLHLSMKRRTKKHKGSYWHEGAYTDQERIEMMDLAEVTMAPTARPSVKLRKEDFLGLVDLYFYSHRTRFLSESPDASPTPLQLDDYSFKVSEDFTRPTNTDPDMFRDDEGTPVSPLHHVEAEIKARKMNEIKALQKFVDLLMDDYSPLHDLFRAYKSLPQPGVSYLSGGIIRLFLQRMSTPWKTSEKAMLRYLSLLDDMQLAGLPVTVWEWSSAIYLAGQSFSNVSSSDVCAAFRVWRQMEKDAGVAARDVTFNILFDIAVKAQKFVLAEELLKEMHDRGFRLNRLGRVSLIYYYGKKGDGDGVRKAYRDFVEAGEIVDTLVLNCVMASLINAQEPAAAEQIYERMKGLQGRLRKGINTDGEEALFRKYPPPGPDKIGAEMASNALGRILLNASRLKTVLPEHHTELQNVMPLTPDVITYRVLISHHAKTSGNIDRLTVLLDDMTRHFRIPITDLTFQSLFRGFAMHGGSDRSDAKWTQQRLQIAWAACVVCMKAGKARDIGTSQKLPRLDLPGVEDAEAMAADDEKRANEEASKRPKPRKPTAWDTFIKQFATPYPEPKPFDLYSTSPDAAEPLAEDEGGPGEEYRIPTVGLTPRGASEDPQHMSPIQPNKRLVLWAIRAFTRCTASRSVLEDVWYQITRVWRPRDLSEKAVAIRELRRALRYCDIHGKE
jgi:pentatricopeptide repeat protein